jgi:hypothetical protein
MGAKGSTVPIFAAENSPAAIVSLAINTASTSLLIITLVIARRPCHVLAVVDSVWDFPGVLR